MSRPQGKAGFPARLKRGWSATVAVGLGLLAAGGCGQGGAPSAGDTSAPVPEQTFFDQRMVETVRGERRWVLHSDLMNQYAGQQDVVLVTVSMDFFRDGDLFSTLTADSGRANTQTHDVRVWGDVRIRTTDGRTLQTEQLFFDNKTQLVTNDVFNRYTWEGGAATGMGIEASTDLEYFEIKRDFASEVDDAQGGQGDGSDR